MQFLKMIFCSQQISTVQESTNLADLCNIKVLQIFWVLLILRTVYSKQIKAYKYFFVNIENLLNTKQLRSTSQG